LRSEKEDDLREKNDFINYLLLVQKNMKKKKFGGIEKTCPGGSINAILQRFQYRI